MSEAMLTRERLEHWREHLTYIEPQAADEMNALIDMALASIAMREALKPFAERAGKYDGYRDSTPVSTPIGDLRRAKWPHLVQVEVVNG